MNRRHVLIVEDDTLYAELLAYHLTRDQYRTSVVSTGEDALIHITDDIPDLIVLDATLPFVSGFQFCQIIRKKDMDTPVIMISELTDEKNVLEGYDNGADYYLKKPFSIDELNARVRALLRRKTLPDEEVYTYADIELNVTCRRAMRNGRAIHLGPTEFKLLYFFMQFPQRIFSREQILGACWGRDVFVEPRTVDVHIRKLREALIVPDESDPIRTVRSVGYGLDEKP